MLNVERSILIVMLHIRGDQNRTPDDSRPDKGQSGMVATSAHWETLKRDGTVERFEALLPWNIDRADVAHLGQPCLYSRVAN